MLPLMIVKSPRCDDLVTLPAGLTPDTRVRCPYTKEEFLIQEILDSLPPMLEVIDGPPAAEVAVAPTAEAVGATAALADDAETDAAEDLLTPEIAGDASAAVAEEEGETPAPAGDAMFDFLHGSATAEAEPGAATETKGAALFEPAGEGAASAAGVFDVTGEGTAEGAAESTAAPARMKVRPRPKKKPKSPVVEIIKVVLGGFGGLLIAQIILWWAVPTGCSANPDPIGLAPKLPGFLQWMAPERVRNPDTMPPTAPPVEGTQQGNGQQDPQLATLQQTPEQLGTPFPAPGTGDTSDNGGNVSSADAGSSGLDVEIPGVESDALGSDRIDELDVENPLAEIPAEPSKEILGVLNPPEFTGQDLGESLSAAKAQRDEMEALGGLEGKDMRAVAAFYMPFCKLAERATYVNPNDLQARAQIEEVEETLKELGKDNRNLNALGTVTEYYLDMKGTRKSNGILLAGVVRKIEPRGKLHGTSVAVAGTDERVVMVLSRIDPKGKISEGDRVIILGAMVKDPSANLGGYEGSQSEVVWGGLPVVLPKAGGRRPGKTGGGG
jgi:hypothetical protein